MGVEGREDECKEFCGGAKAGALLAVGPSGRWCGRFGMRLEEFLDTAEPLQIGWDGLSFPLERPQDAGSALHVRALMLGISAGSTQEGWDEVALVVCPGRLRRGQTLADRQGLLEVLLGRLALPAGPEQVAHPFVRHRQVAPDWRLALEIIPAGSWVSEDREWFDRGAAAWRAGLEVEMFLVQLAIDKPALADLPLMEEIARRNPEADTAFFVDGLRRFRAALGIAMPGETKPERSEDEAEPRPTQEWMDEEEE